LRNFLPEKCCTELALFVEVYALLVVASGEGMRRLMSVLVNWPCVAASITVLGVKHSQRKH
jgi:hypothetical protein